jgi:hypothetical protein
MDSEKKLRTIEDELALLKGDLKETLSSVRDYLLNVDPVGGDNTPLPPENKNKEKAEIQKPVDNSSDTNEESQALDDGDMETDVEPEMEEFFESEEPLIASIDLPYESQPDEYSGHDKAPSQSVPSVSFLANLINWVSVARREIGDEQLPAFLEVYGISGYLSQEMKNIILHLSKITSEKPGEKTTAETWSNSILSLHSILTGYETSLSPGIPRWDGDEEVPEALEDKPARSKKPVRRR